MAKAKPLGWVAERPSKACVDIRVESFRRRKDWEFWCLLTTDRHWDNPDSDHDMQKRHMDEAVERGSPIICNGDFFCAMQGKYDKRASKDKLRPEHQSGRYFALCRHWKGESRDCNHQAPRNRFDRAAGCVAEYKKRNVDSVVRVRVVGSLFLS